MLYRAYSLNRLFYKLRDIHTIEPCVGVPFEKGHYTIENSTIQPLYKKELTKEQLNGYITSQILQVTVTCVSKTLNRLV